MPRVKIDYVVSFSNEDSENQASNLLSWEVSKKRWLCSPGEPSCSVVLQLARAVKISSVQIGAHNTALLEVLVGRSETPSEPFQVLIPRSVFLSPAESRAAGRGGAAGAAGAAGAGGDRVRSFGAGGLGAAAAQRWDRVRLVCSQPYNNHCKYGVSFIHLFEPEGESIPLVPARALALEFESSDDEEFRPGELFAKYRAAGDPGTQIRQATSQALKNNPEAATNLVRTSLIKQKHKHKPTDNSEMSRDPQRDKRNLIYNKDDEQPHDKIDHIVQRHNDSKTPKHEDPPTVDKTPCSKRTDPSTSRNSNKTKLNEDKDRTIEGDKGAGKEGDKNSGKESDKDRRKERDKDSGRKRDDSGGQADKNRGFSSKKKKEERGRKRLHSDRDRAETSGDLRPGQECDRPLQGVVFVLSGYQNPRRSRLRELAAALGATYQREWGPSCTHLICAFNNTPKLLEVRSRPGGDEVPVPTACWLEECGRSRRRLPWQWFAVDPKLRISPPPTPSDPQHSECDTDDEIEKVVQQKRTRASRRDNEHDVQLVNDNKIQDKDKDNITVECESGDETSIEESRCAVERLRPERGLPPLLAGCALLLDEALVAPLDVQLMRRYCIAYGGLPLKPSEVEDDSDCLVLCGSAGCLQPLQPLQGSMPSPRRRARRVRADWLWACHKQQTLLPLDHYLLD